MAWANVLGIHSAKVPVTDGGGSGTSGAVVGGGAGHTDTWVSPNTLPQTGMCPETQQDPW